MLFFSPTKKVQLEVLYTSIGMLPKIGGSYLTSRKSSKNYTIQQDQQPRKEITSLDIESARKRLHFELRRNSLREHRNYSENAARQRISTQSTRRPQGKKRPRKLQKMDHLNFLSPRKLHPKQQAANFGERQLEGDNRSEQKQPSPSFCLKKDRRIDSDTFTTANKEHLGRLKVKFNECQIDKLQTGIQLPSRIKIQPEDKLIKRYIHSDRIEKTLMTNRRNSLIEKFKKKYSQSREISLPQIKQQKMINQSNLFKRYQEVSEDYYRCYTEGIQQKLRKQ